jgi:hypothetical protein
MPETDFHSAGLSGEKNMNFWTAAANTASVISMLTFAASSYTAYRLWRQNRQLRELCKTMPPIQDFQELLKRHEGVKSTSPVALALSLTPAANSIKNSVESFFKTQGWSMPIEELNMNGINNRQDIENFLNLLKQKRRFIDEAGYTEVHLFISGPVQAATVVGAFFVHWIPVKLYHKSNVTQTYEYWMPIVKI